MLRRIGGLKMRKKIIMLLTVGILFILGALMAYIYKKHMKSSMYYDVFIVNFLCYFVFFSFFGTFSINSAPWEILIYSIFIPNLFIKN